MTGARPVRGWSLDGGRGPGWPPPLSYSSVRPIQARGNAILTGECSHDAADHPTGAAAIPGVPGRRVEAGRVGWGVDGIGWWKPAPTRWVDSMSQGAQRVGSIVT